MSVHLTGVYIAYSITTQNKNVGAMRIVNRRTDDRILLKGMKGSVKDLGFAHIKDEVVIGCVDELGNLFVYRVLETASGMTSERVVEVSENSLGHFEDFYSLLRFGLHLVSCLTGCSGQSE